MFLFFLQIFATEGGVGGSGGEGSGTVQVQVTKGPIDRAIEILTDIISNKQNVIEGIVQNAYRFPDLKPNEKFEVFRLKIQRIDVMPQVALTDRIDRIIARLQAIQNVLDEFIEIGVRGQAVELERQQEQRKTLVAGSRSGGSVEAGGKEVDRQEAEEIIKDMKDNAVFNYKKGPLNVAGTVKVTFKGETIEIPRSGSVVTMEEIKRGDAFQSQKYREKEFEKADSKRRKVGVRIYTLGNDDPIVLFVEFFVQIVPGSDYESSNWNVLKGEVRLRKTDSTQNGKIEVK